MPVAVGRIHTIAGTGAKGYAGDGGPALQALLNEPFMCAFDADGQSVRGRSDQSLRAPHRYRPPG